MGKQFTGMVEYVIRRNISLKTIQEEFESDNKRICSSSIELMI